MNKYLLRTPYSYRRFGNYSCIVYANSESEALDLAREFGSHSSEEYDDNSDNDEEMDFEYSETEVELEEENVEAIDSNDNESSFSHVPPYFLAELLQL